MDGKVIGGREISVVLSKESRKTPREMSRREDEYRGNVVADCLLMLCVFSATTFGQLG